MSGEVQIEALNLKKSFQTSLKNGFKKVRFFARAFYSLNKSLKIIPYKDGV